MGSPWLCDDLLYTNNQKIVITYYESSILWYSASHKKGNRINRVYDFSENCRWFIRGFIVTKFSLSSFFWHQLQDRIGYAEQARTISNGDVKNYFVAEWEFKGLTGSCHVSPIKLATCGGGGGEKTFIGHFFWSGGGGLLSCFFCLGLLIVTWISESEQGGHINSTPWYSAQIVFDMHEFKLLPFIHALTISGYVFGIKWKPEKMLWKWSYDSLFQ